MATLPAHAMVILPGRVLFFRKAMFPGIYSHCIQTADRNEIQAMPAEQQDSTIFLHQRFYFDGGRSNLMGRHLALQRNRMAS
jgi:hypothetical protein